MGKQFLKRNGRLRFPEGKLYISVILEKNEKGIKQRRNEARRKPPCHIHLEASENDNDDVEKSEKALVETGQIDEKGNEACIGYDLKVPPRYVRLYSLYE